MHRLVATVIAIVTLSGCGTTYNFSASSDGDIRELYASCVGPHGAFYIYHNKEPVLYLSIRRTETNTEIYLSPHESLQAGNVSWPSAVKFIGNGIEANVSESGILGKSVLQKNMALYVYPGQPDQLEFILGNVLIDRGSVSIGSINFNYEKRRYLMCVQ